MRTVIHAKYPAVFLDRDGTICVEKNYLSKIEDLELIPGSAEAIHLLNKSGYKVVIISNQSGIAKGYLDEHTVKKINEALILELAKHKAQIDGIFYCPHHPKGFPPFNKKCLCRKPAPGMILKASQQLKLDVSQSVVIGDKLSDIETAHRLKIPGILVLTGYGKSQLRNSSSIKPEYIANHLLDAVIWWLKKEK